MKRYVPQASGVFSFYFIEFLMVDYDDQLAHEFEDARNELYKQVSSLVTKLHLLWEVVRAMIVFFIPVVTGIGLSFICKSYFPGSLAVVSSTIFNAITVGLVFLNLMPLNEAITSYLDSRVYTPKFVDCKCKKCHDRNNCSNEQGDKQSAENNTGSASDQQDKQTKDTTYMTGITVGATDDGPRIRNVVKEQFQSKDTSQDSKISNEQKSA